MAAISPSASTLSAGTLPFPSFSRSATQALYTAVHVLVAPNDPPDPAPGG
jgi:hypothetical protein